MRDKAWIRFKEASVKSGQEIFGVFEGRAVGTILMIQLTWGCVVEVNIGEVTNLAFQEESNTISAGIQFWLNKLRMCFLLRVGIVHKSVHINRLSEFHICLGLIRLQRVAVELDSLQDYQWDERRYQRITNSSPVIGFAAEAEDQLRILPFCVFPRQIQQRRQNTHSSHRRCRLHPPWHSRGDAKISPLSHEWMIVCVGVPSSAAEFYHKTV